MSKCPTTTNGRNVEGNRYFTMKKLTSHKMQANESPILYSLFRLFPLSRALLAKDVAQLTISYNFLFKSSLPLPFALIHQLSLLSSCFLSKSSSPSLYIILSLKNGFSHSLLLSPSALFFV